MDEGCGNIAFDYEQFQDRAGLQRQMGPTYRYKRRVLAPLLDRIRASRLLDIGCGSGDFSCACAGSDNVVCPMDIALVAAQQTRTRCKGKVRPIVGTAEALPCRSGCFDAVLCLDVLEHCRQDAKVVSEAARVLKPGGLVIITVPADPEAFDSLDASWGHLRRYTQEALLTMVAPSFETEFSSDYGWPVQRLYRRLLRYMAGAVEKATEADRPSLITSVLASVSYAAMQVDRLFEGNGRGIQLVYLGCKRA